MNIRSKRAAFLAAPVALASVVVVVSLFVSGVLSADQPVPFPGRESGARVAADRGLAVGVDAQTETNGLTLKVIGFVADDAQTMVSYELAGRESDGETAFGVSPPVLVDAQGGTYPSTRGSVDPGNHRKGTWVFPAISPTAGTLAVVVDGFELGIAREGQPITVTRVPGTWRAEFAWGGRIAPSGRAVKVDATPQAFGRGKLRIDSVTQAATGTIVRGTLMGFSPETIQKMTCPAGDLETAAGGSPVGAIACRLGFGEGYRSFEVNYPPTVGRVKLNFELQYQDEPAAPGYRVEDLSDRGAKAAVQMELPAP